MGIHKLTELIKEKAPRAIKHTHLSQYSSKRIAIDASMTIYQALVVIRSGAENLKNRKGETTAHLVGMFYRTARLVENGITPVYVFDGAAPKMKEATLAKRKRRKEEAEAALLKLEQGQEEELVRMAKRTTRATQEHTDECKKMLDLMGVPHTTAPSEAEAFCAFLNKTGHVYAVASDDMDSLTFGGKILLKHFMTPEAKKIPISEIHLSGVLKETGLSMGEFTDLCILLGCDYCEAVKGVGVKRAYDLIKKHGTIERIIAEEKVAPPVDWKYKEARALFAQLGDNEVEGAGKHPEIKRLECTAPREEDLVQFMVETHNFDEKRVRNVIGRLKQGRKGSAQRRLDSYFAEGA